MSHSDASRHVERKGSFLLPATPDRVFPLFTAEGERAWIPGWHPEYLHPSHPSNAEGTVFRTHHGGEETLWIVLRCAADEGVATYGRFTPGSRLGTVHVECTEESAHKTRVTITYTLTALTETGADVLRALTPESYAAMLRRWREMILPVLSGRTAEAT